MEGITSHGNDITAGVIDDTGQYAKREPSNPPRVDGIFAGSGSGRSGAFGDIVIDPREFSTSGGGTSEPERKRRGRKPGSKNAEKKSTANLKDAISSGIFLFHGFLFATFKAPELQLSSDESDRLAAAFDKLMACYDVGVSQKTAAWIEVGSALSGVYGGRMMHYYLRSTRLH